MRPVARRAAARRLAVRDADERDMILGDLAGRARRARRAPGTARQADRHRRARARPARPNPAATSAPFRRLVHEHLAQGHPLRAGGRCCKRPLADAAPSPRTLALGLGANAAIFNLIDRLVLRPFPFADPDTVVMLAETGPGLEFAKEVGLAGQLPRLARGRPTRDRPSAGAGLVGRQPARRRTTPSACRAIARVGRLLRRARRAPGARPRLRARRRDLRPPSRRRPQRRAVEAALRRRPGDRRPQRHASTASPTR